MPPYQLDVLQAQPDIEVRQDATSSGEVVLSITHASTTYTTTIDLAPTSFPSSNPTIAPSPAQTSQIELQSNDPSSPSTGVIVGAVLGSILGTLVLLTCLYKCCIDNRSAAWIPPRYSSYDSDSDNGRSLGSGVGTRGGGFDDRRDRVRRPDRARTRHRNMSERSGVRSEVSWGTRHRRRRSSLKNKDGLLGWFLVPRTRPYYNYERRTGWLRDSRERVFSPDD